MKHRIFAALALALALMLPACADIQAVGTAVSTAAGISVPQKDVGAAVQAFAIAERGVTAYLVLPSCKVGQTALNACKDATRVPLIGRDIRAGRAGRDTLWNASKANPGGAALRPMISAVMASVASLNADISK